jgi:two-component system LytT family response regulator
MEKLNPDNHKKITAMIIDDEVHCIETLQELLMQEPRVRIVAAESDPKRAIRRAIAEQPELLLLDIQMPERSGFDLLHDLRDAGLSPHVIFVTAHSEFAIEAIRSAAFDYILKPVDPAGFTLAIDRYFQQLNGKQPQDFELLLKKTAIEGKIRFNVIGGFILIDYRDIVYVKADWNYSEVVLSKERSEMITSNLGAIEKMVAPYPFFRINRSALINLNYLVRVKRVQRKCYLRKGDEEFELTLSASRLKELDRLNQ